MVLYGKTGKFRIDFLFKIISKFFPECPHSNSNDYLLVLGQHFKEIFTFYDSAISTL